jgi:enterochelin esterase-like enzyme
MLTDVQRIFIIVLFSYGVHDASAQDNYLTFSETIRSLYSTKEQKDLNALWDALVSEHKIPISAADSIAFLYRGEARSVTWMGDFNGWGSNKAFNNQGTRIPDTDIWIMKTSLPRDSRLDYKILINDSDFILDPSNIQTQWSGVGGGSLNSELRMPDWNEDPVTSRLSPDARQGKTERDLLLYSRELGYQITYNIYTPPGWQKTEAYPVLYVTDGFEYMHERMGNMVTILDNLIHENKIQPVVVVFVDHRIPVNRLVNRRMQELAMNEKYMNFICGELIPLVEEKFTVARGSSHRAIIGTSLGGLTAAWFAFARPDVFGMAGIQSPAFWFKPEIYSICDTAQSAPAKIFMSTGLIHDSEEGARKMKTILDKKNLRMKYKEVNQGHSWGNWRDLVDDMLIFLVPPGS